jgi:hypothetical protein
MLTNVSIQSHGGHRQRLWMPDQVQHDAGKSDAAIPARLRDGGEKWRGGDAMLFHRTG